MCAIDALGIASMFEEPTEIRSVDPVSGQEIRAPVAPSGETEWRPESAVVVAGALARQGDSWLGCCPVLNFFVSGRNAERWLDEHQEVRGDVIAMPEAIAAGRAVFSQVLERV
jgi:Alkylmercury lyase